MSTYSAFLSDGKPPSPSQISAAANLPNCICRTFILHFASEDKYESFALVDTPDKGGVEVVVGRWTVALVSRDSAIGKSAGRSEQGACITISLPDGARKDAQIVSVNGSALLSPDACPAEKTWQESERDQQKQAEEAKARAEHADIIRRTKEAEILRQLRERKQEAWRRIEERDAAVRTNLSPHEYSNTNV